MDPGWQSLLDTARKTKHAFGHDLPDHLAELGFLAIASLAGYGWRFAKGWYQHDNAPEKQATLCREAERLLKLRSTLAIATDPLPKLTSAQEVLGNQLNKVLSDLSHVLTQPEEAGSKSRLPEILGQYLLLYRAKGFVSVSMHWIFYFLVLAWALVCVIGFKATPNEVGLNIAVSIIFLSPVVLWNYLTRKVDKWLRNRHSTTAATSVVVVSK